MIAVIQLVTQANVQVDGKIIGAIKRGIVALIGIEKSDTLKEAQHLINKIIHYRIFPDENGKTNLSLKEVDGGLLLVPQFTLVADTQSGTRPGFSRGMPPSESRILFAALVQDAKKQYAHIATGEFGANMQVSLCNDGPATFLLKT